MPINHYGLEVGQLRVGDPADFIEVDSLTEFNVLRTWIDGRLVAERGKTSIDSVDVGSRQQVRADEARGQPTLLSPPLPTTPRNCK